MDCLSKSRAVCYGGNEMRFFTGMHISRTKLYSDSVHLLLCNKYVCVQTGFYVDMSFTHAAVARPTHPQVRCASGNVRFQSKHHWCIFLRAPIRSVLRGRGVTQPHSPLHAIGQKYEDVTFLWFFKAFNGNDIFLFPFCIQSALYLCRFYNVSF